MIKSIIIVVIVLIMLTAAGSSYYYFLYPPFKLERATEHALKDFSKAVASKDRAKVGESLQRLLADSAVIKLEVSMKIIGANNANPAVQDFTKASFTNFIDNILYSLNDFAYEPKLDHFSLASDMKTAEITFSSHEWGDGISYNNGLGVNMHFSSETTCEGDVVFELNIAQLSNAVCKVQLHSSLK